MIRQFDLEIILSILVDGESSKMTEAIFGLIGVLIGSSVTWIQAYWTNRQTTNKNARYLAIRLVCIFNKYLEDCADVVKDDGLSYGQRTEEGYLKPQVKAPGPPVFPNDVDWRSIDKDLMYEILSLSSEVESADRIIKAAGNMATPPDYDEWFSERAFWYGQFGLTAYKLSKELCEAYNIQMKTYGDWNPVTDLKNELLLIQKRRDKEKHSHDKFVE